MEGIFETVTVTARVWSTSRYREKILSLFCRVKNSDMGNGKSWKWAPRQIKIHRTKKEKSKGRKEESDPRKELDASRMTSRCKRIGMIRYSFLKQEGNNSIEKLIKNLFDHVHRKSLYENYKNIREIFITVINCRKMKWKLEKLWSKNFFATKSYKFYKNGISVRISIGKGLNHITEWKLQFRKYIIFLVKEYNKKYHLRYY